MRGADLLAPPLTILSFEKGIALTKKSPEGLPKA